jgi:hypothetical protein
MALESLENYNETKPEYSVEQPAQFLDIERGDIDPMSLSGTQAQNQLSSSAQTKPKVDPLELVRGMISTGFTPTPTQLSGAADDIGGSNSSSNTWFAIFLQKLLRQSKGKKR